jgi:hypothetical protein
VLKVQVISTTTLSAGGVLLLSSSHSKAMPRVTDMEFPTTVNTFSAIAGFVQHQVK